MAELSYSLLCRDRDLSAYAVVGAAQVAVAFLNLDEVPKALQTLLGALTDYQIAAEKVEEFHCSQIKQAPQSQSAAKEAA